MNIGASLTPNTSDFTMLQKRFLNTNEDSKDQIIGIRSKEFTELQEAMIVIYTTAKLLEYKAHMNEKENSVRIYLPDGIGLTTINLREVFNRVSLKIYKRNFESIYSTIMSTETYVKESKEEKLKALQEILENL